MTSRGRRVGGPGGILLGLVLAGAVWLLGGLEHRVAASGYRAIRTERSRLDNGTTWVDRRWERELEERLARLGPQDANDPEARARIVDEIRRLSFIDTTGEPEIEWPDGLRVPVRFQNPVACIAVGELFYPVAADGTVLSGSWESPPLIASGWLPVIGGVGMHYPDARPGDVLERDVERDALSIAVSMWLHLSPENLGALGRMVIDAERGRETGPLEPGARLHLEGGREIWFGRPPSVDAPGSLPEETKWANLSAALDALRSGDPAADWDRVDLRWDRPEMHVPGEPEPGSGDGERK